MTIAQIPLPKAELLALFLESILYGGFVALYIIFLLIVFGRKRRERISKQRKIWAVIATSMLVLGTAHLIIDFVRVLQAFVTGPHLAGGAAEYYEDLSDPLHVAKTVVYVIITSIGDGVMIWRFWVMYGKTLWVAIPMSAILFTNAAFGFVVCWSLSAAKTGATVFQTATAFITSFFVLTMVINITSTIGIAYRIISRNFSGNGYQSGGAGNLIPIAVIVVESGAIYSASVLALLVSYVTGSNGQYPALDTVTPIVGIVFVLIILQIYFQLDSKNVVATATISGSERQRYPLQSLAVHVSRTQEEYHNKGELGDMHPYKTAASILPPE